MKIFVYLKIAWNWLWLRVYVFGWLLWRGNLGQFGRSVTRLEEMQLARTRQLLWELVLRGEVRREIDPLDGEYRYYAVEKKE